MGRLPVISKLPAHRRNAIKKYKRKCADFVRAARIRPCADCGVYTEGRMEFDHLDRSQKKIKIGRQKFSVGMRQLIAEIAKCEVVCRPCHHKRSMTRGDYKHA